MPNTNITPSWTLREVVLGFLNELGYARNLTRTYDDKYSVAGAKVGYTVNARMPQRFQATRGQALQTQALYDATVPISLTDQINVAFSYSSAEATAEIQDVRERYVQPAAETLANACDVMAWDYTYRDVYNNIGDPGAGPVADTAMYFEAGVKLTDLCTPMDGRIACLDPWAMAKIANTATTLFNPGSVSSEAFRKGKFGSNVLGIAEWYADQNRPVHTTGTYTACTPLINGANQTGSTLVTNGWASGATSLKKGDTFTIDGVYSVNPLSYQSTGRLQDFVVTADTSDSGGAIAALPISPPIITSGQLQTVSASPADDAAINVTGATSSTNGTLATTNTIQSMIFVPDFAAFVMADLEAPQGGVETARVRGKKWNISMRMVKQYQIGTDQNPCRLDVLVGAATVQPRLACRIYS